MPGPNNLPLLPGYRIDTAPKVDHKKSHIFDVNSVHGTRPGILTVTENNVTFEDRTLPLTAHKTLKINEVPADYPKPTAADVLAKAPSWVAFDRKVLRFFCYFREGVVSSAQEHERVRKCVLYFYLEDESIHIAEPKVENSGIPQGTFVKRHRVPRADGSGFINVEDLSIGRDLLIYGRTFHVVDSDGFTRRFYEANGMMLDAAEEYPVDRFTCKNTHRAETHHKLMNPMKEHMEASLGKPIVGMDVTATQRFLRNDGKVLRFFCVYDDTRMFGEKRPYILHYFLADETVEVLELHQPNSGRSPFPTMLKRAKLPMEMGDSLASVATIGVSHSDPKIRYYAEKDFRVGSTVNVYGRTLFICGCDAFTKQFYINNLGLTDADFPDLAVDDAEPEAPRLAPPPHSGFGTEEDSLGSFLYLTPKLPKRDFKKLMENDGRVLRYLSRFVNPAPVDKDRRFIITYYLNNDTMGIFEKFERNSGFIGGKFLERGRVKNLDSGDYFKCHDFAVGNVITVNQHKFELIEADEYTSRFVETNPHLFGMEQKQQEPNEGYTASWSRGNTPPQKNATWKSRSNSRGSSRSGGSRGANSPSQQMGMSATKGQMATAAMPTAAALYANDDPNAGERF